MGLEDRELVDAKEAPATITAPTPGGSSAPPPVPGGSSPMPRRQPQAPTGFSGPTPAPRAAPHTGMASPMPSNRDLNLDQFSPETQTALNAMASAPAFAWNETQRETLKRSLLVTNSTMTEGPRLNQMMNTVMENTDPSILTLAEQKFTRQVSLTTTEMFEERAMQRMIGYIDDEEAFSAATNDLWLDTWGSVWAAGQVFDNADTQKTFFTEGWLGNQDTFNAVESQASTAARAVLNERYGVTGTDRAGAWGAYQADDIIGDARGAIRQLTGKGGAWAVDGNNLALQLSDGEGTWNVLVRLKPGTKIETSADAAVAYALAMADAEHAIDPSSDDVAGPQALLGKVWEGLDDVILSIEKWGTSGTIPSLNEQIAAVDGLMMQGPRNPTVDGKNRDAESLRENVAGSYTEKSHREAILINIARNSPKDANSPMTSVVAAGVNGLAMLTDQEVYETHTESINSMVEAAQQKQAETSYIGTFLQEEVFPPVLTALEAWENSLQFIGTSLLHVSTSDEIAALGQKIAEEGIGALFDPANLALAPGIDYMQLQEDFRDIQENGLPAFTAAFTESFGKVTIADEYGLEPGTAAWNTVNTAGSVLFDPITWLTLGGNASWKGLQKTLTTVAGAREYVYRPHVVSALSQLVKKNDTNIVTMFITEGMPSSSISRLAKIAATTYTDDAARIAAIGEAQNILFNATPAMGGTWLPAGPARALTRKTTLGLGQFFAQLGSKGTNLQKYHRLAQDILARAPRQRFAAIGEREFLSDAATRLTIMYGDDAAKYASKLDEAIAVYDAARVGDDAIAMIQGNIQATRAELAALSGGITADVKFVPTLAKNVKQMDDSIRALDDMIERRLAAGDDATAANLRVQRDKAIASRDQSQAFLDELNPTYADVTATIRDKQKLLDRYLKQQEMLGTGERDRGIMERWTHALYDEWAERINQEFVEKGWATADDLPIPIVEGQVHPWFPDLPMRNWSRVTGDSSAQTYRTQAASNLESFGATADDLRSIGMGAVAGSTRLPASPYELLAFTHTRPSVWNGLHNTAVGRGFGELMNGIQSLWSAQVLLNPRTSIRSSLDEVIRFYEDAGLSVDAVKAAYRSVPGTANVGGGVGPEARAFARDQLDNFLPSSAQAWEMVDPAARGMWVHAERWVNGTLMQDPQFKAFARAVFEAGDDDAAARALWETWWNETGSKLSRRHTFSASSTRAGQPITAGNSYDILKGSFDTWLEQIGNQQFRAEARASMIAAAADNKIVDEAAAFWRQMGSVPGSVNTGRQAGKVGQAMEGGFNLMYGSPQVRRGGVFYDHYEDFAMQSYLRANGGRLGPDGQWVGQYASQGGRILDAEYLLRNGHAASLSEAQNLIAGGTRNITVRQVVAESGFVLEADLKNAAMRWAATNADNMMYTFGAGSILGKKMSRLYPFGRAQVDYMQWWVKKLTQPTRWGTPGAAAPRFIGPTNNVNLRLIDRMAHILNTGEPQQPGEYEKPSPWTPAGVIENLTFFPSTLDSQTVMEIPSFGPMPGWMVNLPLDDVIPGWAGIRTAILETNPSLMQFTEPYADWGDATWGLFDTIVPKSGLSTWNLGKAVINAGFLAAAHASLGLNPEDPTTPEVEGRINVAVNQLIWEKDTPFFRDRASTNYAEWLTENGADQLPDINNPEWIAILDASTIETLENSLTDTLQRVAGVAVQGGSDFQYTNALMPVIDYVEAWYENGWISEAKRDSIVIGHRVIEDGDAAPKDRLVFADDVLDSLFTLLPGEERTKFLAENPGAAINFVSWYNIVPSLIPEYARHAVSGMRITAVGEEGRELRTRGRADGWITAKDPNQYMYEAHMSVQRAYRDRLADIYEEVVNTFDGAAIYRETTDNPNLPVVFATDTQGFRGMRGPVGPDWWAEHGEWLEGVKGFKPPDGAVAAWTAGADFVMTLGDFRDMFVDARKRYAYQYTDDTVQEAMLSRLGDYDQPPTKLAQAVTYLEGFEDVTLDVQQPLSYYGADLVKDLKKAVNLADTDYGWSDPREWEHEFGWSEDGTVDTIQMFDYEQFRDRIRGAVALSSLSPDDDMTFTEKEYQASQWYRWFGEINFKPPEPPPLPEVAAAHTTTPDRVTVVDGDTVKVMGDDGPVFLRLLGINAPEQGTPGGGASSLALMDLIDDADEVSFGIWQPERYGRTQSFFTEEDGAVTYRDRVFVWLYVDGVPYYDSTVFTPTNVRGVGTGGEAIPDYAALANGGTTEGGD